MHSPWLVAGMLVLGMLLGNSVQALFPTAGASHDTRNAIASKPRDFPPVAGERGYVLNAATRDAIITHYTQTGDYRRLPPNNKRTNVTYVYNRRE